MRSFRARYVTVCQQFLVTAAVAAVGLSAAGVMTLQIVAPEATGPQALAPAIDVSPVPSRARVETEPVTPKVREVKVASVPSADRTAVQGKKVAAVSAPTQVHGYATVGVTWKPGTEIDEDAIDVQVRTKKDGRWSEWSTAEYHDEHGPDAGTPEAARAEELRPGTDAVVVGDVDEVQMRAATTTGAAPEDLELAVVDPGADAGAEAEEPAIDTGALPSSAGDLTLSAMDTAPRPRIYSRAQWGANEKLRDAGSLRYGTVKAGFIHHTVNANNYSSDQVPALIRGIYAYHTQSRGWSDIGYNFLVDRFGRIWEGRYGGVNRAVVGAHTLGYNEYSFAMSAIGNFDVAQPPQAVLDAYAELFAWKLSLYDIRADKPKVWVKNRYLQAINGHRDAGSTACPGRYLYAKLGAIRLAAQRIQNTGIVPTPPPTPTDPAQMVPLAAPADVPLPTATPLDAVPQPDIDFPARRSIVGTEWPDIVAKAPNGVISLVTTGGMLGYDPPVRNAGPWRYMSLITAVGDVTGDGKGDVLAKTAKTGFARIFRSDGKGHVSSRGFTRTGTYAFKRANLILAGGDVNRDGKGDVLSRDRRTGALMLHRGNGNGTFKPATVLRSTWRYSYSATADLNRDGRLDLIGLRSDNALVFIPGKGGTTARTSFGPGRVIARIAGRVTGVVAGPDSTGDGRPDVGVRTSDGQFRLYTGTGNGGLGFTWGPFTDPLGLAQLTSANMRGSGATDLVGRDSAGSLRVLTNNGHRNVVRRIKTNLVVAETTQVFSVGDWDKDGHADLITREIDNNRLVLRPGLGNGKFDRGRSLGNGWRPVTRLASVGDVTGDGFPDLLGRIGGSPLIVFPGNGRDAFKAPVYAPASLRTFNQIGGAAWSPLGTRFVSSDGTFLPMVGSDVGSALRATNGPVATSYDTYVGAGDADGDGVADLLAREKGTGKLWLLPGKTSGGLAPRTWVANGFAGYQLIG